jgi:hypothetical protein
MKTAIDSTARLRRKTTHAEELEQSRGALSKNLIPPLPYRIVKASGSGDLLSRSPVHIGARDGVDYNDGASSKRWQNLDRFQGVCGGSRVKVYIGAAEENPSNVGHAHIARPSRLQQLTI